MRKVFLFAAAAAMLAACSSKDIDTSQPDVSTQAPLEENAVGFDAYQQRATSTRAGYAGVMELAGLQSSGFGVFGYYTDNNDYEQSRIPDFMYNQKVEYSGGSWNYEPVKYWPNEYGNSAISDDNDRVSFFAYAPYVEVSPSSGKLIKEQSDDDQWGITGMTRNSAAGDPLIKYIGSFEATKSVDLMWGVCDDPNWAIVQGGSIQQINEGKLGLPWLDVQRPMYPNNDATNNKRMKFTFKHALAQFSVNVDARVDATDNDNALAEGTKIYVRQISFTGLALKGALNLNNTEKDKAVWMDYNGNADIESGAAIVIYDGLKDGKEGTAGAKASNEKTIGFNPQVISNYDETTNKGNTMPGVTNVAKSLFENSTVMVIPTGEDLEVEIVYDVETADPNLSTMLSDGKTNGSSIENRISKTVNFGEANMENGKHYTLNLHLGMNSVTFDAAISPWVEAGSGKPDVDLPLNVPSFTALTTPALNTVNITSDGQDYVFAVTGLNPGETVTLSGSIAGTTSTLVSNDLVTAATNADAAGVIYVKVANIPENTTVLDKDLASYISVKGNTSGAAVQLAIKQLAHKLALGAASVAADKITLSSGATGVDWTAGTTHKYWLKKNGAYINASENGVDLATADIALTETPVAGDVYEITVKLGDAAEETWVANIGGIKFSPTAGTVTYRQSQTYDAPYTVISNKAQTVNTVSGTPAVATIAGEKITTLKNGTSVITADINGAADDLVNGWYYTAATKTANYDLTVNRQAAAGTFEQADINGQTITSGGAVATVSATFKGALDTAENADGAVTYSIVSVTKNGAAAADAFVLDANSGALTVGAADLTAGSTYKVTVRASMADGDKYAATTKDVTFNVTTVAL